MRKPIDCISLKMVVEYWLMDDLIKGYDFKLVEAGCAPGSGRYVLQVDIQNDISPIFPYLNALLNETQYDHQNCILIMEGERPGLCLTPSRNPNRSDWRDLRFNQVPWARQRDRGKIKRCVARPGAYHPLFYRKSAPLCDRYLQAFA